MSKVSSDSEDDLPLSSLKTKKRKPVKEPSSDSSESEQESDPDLGDGKWELECIVGHERRKGVIWYNVVWKLQPGKVKDWSDSEDWVREDKMEAEDLTKAYWRQKNTGGRENTRRESSSSGGGRPASPKRRRSNDLEGFVVSDDEIDPPKKDKRKKKKKRLAKSSSSESEVEVLEIRPSKKPKLTHVSQEPRDPGSSDSSMSDFVVSDTEEGVLIPVRVKKHKTPSPVVRSHAKKPTWQEKIHLMKDSYFLDDDDERPVVLTDDEERGQAILAEAEIDEAQKEKERVKRRKERKKTCRKSPPKRRRVIDSSSESESDATPPPARIRDPNVKQIHVDKDKLRQQITKRANTDYASSSKRDRGLVDYRSIDGINSSSFVQNLVKKMQERGKNPGVYRAKESIGGEVDRQCSKIRRISLLSENPSCSKDHIDAILAESEKPDATAPVYSRNSTMDSNAVDFNKKRENVQLTKTKKNRTLQPSERQVIHLPMEPVYVTDTSSPRLKKEKARKERAIVEERKKQEVEEERVEPELPKKKQKVVVVDSSSEEMEDEGDNFNGGYFNEGHDDQVYEGGEVKSEDDVEVIEEKDDEEEDGIQVGTSGDDVVPPLEYAEYMVNGKLERRAMYLHESQIPENWESLPAEHPLFDVFERFALECWDFKRYECIKNNLKPVFIIQFFHNAPDQPESDWCMTVFENKPGELPAHVCECIDTNIMLDIDPQLVIDCEHRLAQPEAAMTMKLIMDKWDRDYERAKKAKARREAEAAKAAQEAQEVEEYSD